MAENSGERIHARQVIYGTATRAAILRGVAKRGFDRGLAAYYRGDDFGLPGDDTAIAMPGAAGGMDF